MPQQNEKMHPQDKRNMVLFVAISVGLFFLYDLFVQKPYAERVEAAATQAKKQQEMMADVTIPGTNKVADYALKKHDDVINENARLPFKNAHMTGSISLKGGRVDDLMLSDYFETKEREDNVTVLSPSGTITPLYAEFGWVAKDPNIAIPTAETQWSVKAGSPDTLTTKTPVTLTWNNGQGLIFERVVSLDENFMFSVKQNVTNNTARDITLFPFSLISRHGEPRGTQKLFILHEGMIGYTGESLEEIDYDDLRDDGMIKTEGKGGWIAFTDKYWHYALVPPQTENVKYRYVYTTGRQDPRDKSLYNQPVERFQVDMMGAPVTIKAGSNDSKTQHFYAGIKKLSLFDEYEEKFNINHFDLSIDFGIFWFMTKPFAYLLTWIGSLVGNFGVAILVFTVMLRIAVFPLANKSFRSFARLKELAPRMKELKEEHGEDRQKMQQALYEMYQKEGVNPVSGCLPMLIQIPIFFALYKTLIVSIEMRHAPFFGWIQDLSAPDPTSFMNLFGLLPYDAPSFLHIGIWPCIMCITMILQRRLHPPANDETQEFMMKLMPFVFTMMLGKFAAGLVIYWAWNNTLVILQQMILMKSMGVKIDFFNRGSTDDESEEEKKEDLEKAKEIAQEVLDEESPKDDEPAKPISPPKPKKKGKGKSKSKKKK